MQHKHLEFGQGFQVVLGDEHSQAAQMTLAPGEVEGGPDNRHRGADQWLFVVAGTGEAVVNGEAVALKPGTLLGRTPKAHKEASARILALQASKARLTVTKVATVRRSGR
jgi:mannose-6-phosphate isomerase-like protein (cupin superfamily)